MVKIRRLKLTGDFYVPANGAMVIDGPDVIVLVTADFTYEIEKAFRRCETGGRETFVSDLRVDQKLVAKQCLELAHVPLRHEDMLEALSIGQTYFSASARCGGCECGRRPCRRRWRGAPPGGSGRRSSPSRRPRASGALAAYAHLLVGNQIRRRRAPWRRGCRSFPGGPRADSRCCRSRLLLDPADAVLEAWCPGLDPGARQLGVAGIGHHALAFLRSRVEERRRERLVAGSCRARAMARLRWRYSRRSEALPGSCSG